MRTKKKYLIKLIIVLLVMLITTISTTFLIYNIYLLTGIENRLRIMISLILVFLNLIFIIGDIVSFRKYKKRFYIRMCLIFIYSIILLFVSGVINRTYSKIANISVNTITYSSSLVTLSANEVTKINDVVGNIGILSDTSNINGNVLPYQIVEEYNLETIIEFDGYVELLNALYEKEVDYIFLPTNYIVMLSSLIEEQFSTLKIDTKIIYTEETVEKNDDKISNTKLTKPFTILIMGVDSEEEEISNASFNGDSLILITFNPTTLSTTMLSIPRDSYVPIACFANQKRSKITHAAWYGEDCMIKTIENLTSIPIDYYLKINFKGVVNLVDNLGGVEVDVEYNFCEQDSNRFWGDATIYVEEGLQTLDGEEALAYSRNRHTNSEYCTSKWTDHVSNDFIRSQHQQDVLKAVLNKLKTVTSLDTVYSLLDTISSSMETNMSTNEILSLYNIGKDVLVNNSSSDVSQLISIQKLYLSSRGFYIYDTSLKQDLDTVVLYKDSVADVVEAMKLNLGLETIDLVKTFTYGIDENYEEEVIGKSYNYSTLLNYHMLTSFVGMTEIEAKSLASSLGLSINIKYTTKGDGEIGEVIYQSYPYNTDIQNVKNLEVTILEEMDETNEEELELDEEEIYEDTTSDIEDDEIIEDDLIDEELIDEEIEEDSTLVS